LEKNCLDFLSLSKKCGEVVCGLKLDFEDNLRLITYSEKDESVLNINGVIPTHLKEKHINYNLYYCDL